MKITIIAGARPNFMKIAPVIHAVQDACRNGKDLSFRLVHTGQHYDRNMSDTFFEELRIPTPNVNLGIGGGTQAEQTAGIMIEFEKELIANPTDLVVVVGDVTSMMVCLCGSVCEMDNAKQFTNKIQELYNDGELLFRMRQAAIEKGKEYSVEKGWKLISKYL